MKNELAELSITEAGKKLADKEISAVELAEACLANIEKKNPSLNAYLEVFGDVKKQAEAADIRRAGAERNEVHPLLGIPLGVKDNILIKGRRASAASRMLENYVASYDSTVASKLKDAGAVFLGRTNMDEFALGGSTENSAFGVTKNPHDPSRVAGGTSGGSAAAVAAHMTLGALGSDTGGSVRNPASFCGVVGLKSTYGAVSRSGLIAAVSSFDQVGPITKTVADAELLFNTIRGKDALDSTCIERSPTRPAKKKIAVLRSLTAGVEPVTMGHFENALKTLRSAGYEIEDIELPSHALALPAYYIINFAEVSTNLARFDGVRYGLSLHGEDLLGDYAASRGAGFGSETRRRIMLGTYVLSAGYYDAYYRRALATRDLLVADFANAFNQVAAVVTPTTPTTAFALGEKTTDPLQMYLADVFTVPANVAGLPALSVPNGVDKSGLPFGFQFVAPHFREDLLFQLGKQHANL